MTEIHKKLAELADKYVREEFQLEKDIEFFREAHTQAYEGFINGFLKRNEMCLYLVHLHSPYPDLSFHKWMKGFELLEECIEKMEDLNFSMYKND